MKELNLDQKIQQSNFQEITDKDIRWSQILNDLCLDLFGEGVFDLFQNHHFEGREIGSNEVPYETNLHPFEKRFYDLVDILHRYLRDNAWCLPTAEGDVKVSIFNSLQNIFWSLIKINHQELLSSQNNLGIRRGYRIVAIQGKSNPPPIIEFLKGGFR